MHILVVEEEEEEVRAGHFLFEEVDVVVVGLLATAILAVVLLIEVEVVAQDWCQAFREMHAATTGPPVLAGSELTADSTIPSPPQLFQQV